MSFVTLARSSLYRGERLLAGWAFPAFLMFTLAFATAVLGVMLVLPTRGTALEQFADEFRVWCFGLDPRTGHLQWAYVVQSLTSPLLLSSFALLVWWQPLREVWRDDRRALWRAAAPAFVLVAGMVATFALTAPSAAQSETAFPGARIRTSFAAPALELTSHEGRTVSTATLRGRVTVVTAIYSTCGRTCPMILSQAKRVARALDEAQRREVSFIAITLDPTHDGRAELARLAWAQGVRAPQFQLLTGEPDAVERTLDAFGFARRRDPRTGVIDHANFFVVLDRRGRVAYRFTLGERQEPWLVDALRELVREPVAD